ncbi:MAG: aldose epimerase family protein [Thiohalocapsa sp.]
MDASGKSFGRLPNGREARLYTLENRQMRVGVTDYGGRLVSLECDGSDGRRDHVVLGFDAAAPYATAKGAFGALLGRNANRIGGGCFTLDGQVYQLSKNENGSTLHGGEIGFDKVIWEVVEAGKLRLVLRHVSPDGDQGFPGEVTVSATWRLDGDTLWLEFGGHADRATPLSLSAHPYFNLAGVAARDIFGHQVEIAADQFLPLDDKQIPTGDIRAVAETVFDLRRMTPIAERIRSPDPQMLRARGYDHYFVLRRPEAAAPHLAARVHEPDSGRVLEILTTQRGVQFYTGNNLNGSAAGRGGAYRQSAGFAFEPQGFPDAPNHPAFPSTILRRGETYRESIGYRFTLG